MAEDKHIAIIGGGIGGLAAAYFLHGRPSFDGRYVFRCSVFEKSHRWGGNAHSAYLDTPYAPPFADFGVNDFNLATYKLMGAVLDQLAADGYPVPYDDLLNTTCFFSAPGSPQPSVCYTVEDLDTPSTPMLKAIANDWKQFNETAYKVMHDPKFAEMSVGAFVEHEGYSDAFRDLNLYPRINGMYFANDRSPAQLPIRGVMSYYHLQEGLGGGTAAPEPQRKYFVNGASDWIHQLVGVLRERQAGLYLNDAPSVVAEEGEKPWVRSEGDPRRTFDAVISAVPANEVALVVRGLPTSMTVLLSAFDYYDSMSVVHDDPSVLPPDLSRWSTYNILIRPPEARELRPYFISYVSKMHQGKNTTDSWFVTLDPYRPLPDGDILDMHPPGGDGTAPAVTYFWHNTITIDGMMAQQLLPLLQGEKGLYYTGGWTNGAGLHEEILAMSSEIATRLRNDGAAGEWRHTYRAENEDHVPKYIRDSFSFEPVEAFPPGFWDDALTDE